MIETISNFFGSFTLTGVWMVLILFLLIRINEKLWAIEDLLDIIKILINKRFNG